MAAFVFVIGYAMRKPFFVTRFAILSAILLSLSGPSIADVAVGLSAYDAGNYTVAFNEFTEAADQGHAGAQILLGEMYGNGQGVPQNDAQAVYWYRRAADQGFAGAQNNLGVQYAIGRGVPQNSIAAYALANVARANGAANAAKLIKFLTEKIPNASVAQAQSLSTRMAKKGALLRELDEFMATRKKQ